MSRSPRTAAGRELLDLNPERAVEFWPVLHLAIASIEDEMAAEARQQGQSDRYREALEAIAATVTFSQTRCSGWAAAESLTNLARAALDAGPRVRGGG